VVDVFISYSRHDKDAVAPLAEKVEAAGYDVWWDAELPPHKSYGDVITEKIGSAKAAIVVWSETAAASEWVRAEADVARNQKKLIQTALGDIIPPLPFNQIQFADIGDWRGEDDHSGWRKVMASLTELCGEREGGGVAAAVTPSPAPAPSPPPAPEPNIEASPPAKWPLFAGLGIGAAGMFGAWVMLAWGDNGTAYYEPVALADPVEQPESMAPAPSPTQSESGPNPEPPTPPPPSYPTTAQTFTGSLNASQSRSFTIGLNANTSYMIVAECDLDCSDIDMWLYDQSGALVDEDVLDDDFPVLEVTPSLSGEYSLRIQMFTCSVDPCGFQIVASPD